MVKPPGGCLQYPAWLGKGRGCAGGGVPLPTQVRATPGRGSPRTDEFYRLCILQWFTRAVDRPDWSGVWLGGRPRGQPPAQAGAHEQVMDEMCDACPDDARSSDCE